MVMDLQQRPFDADQHSRREMLPMTRRQLFQTVKSGQRITFSVFDADPVTGYLAGIDDDHFFVLEPQHDRGFHKKIIREGCCPVFLIHPEASYDDEPEKEEMDVIIRPFRSWVLSQVYGQKPRPEKDVA